ncbi:MAG TPA: phosphopyruvate hydratase [Acidimicrobiia bacterium]|nr:phosphopyruvate hydratase [Acidimicrobiia bacterium]
MQTAITTVHARQILDSRGNPTVEAEVTLAGGGFGRAAVPSGASTGAGEAVELRDGGSRYLGKGVTTAVRNVNETIAPAVIGLDALSQDTIDQVMIDLDASADKSRLGANAILSVSLAVARAAAAGVGVPLYRYLGGPWGRVLPVPCMNVVNGGVHASNSIDIQEFIFVPGGFDTFSEALRAGVECYQSLKKVMAGRGLATNVGDEGGFAPNLPTNRAAIELLVEAVEVAGYKLGDDVGLALDVAASEIYRGGRYHLEGGELTAAELTDYLVTLVDEFPLVSIEDGMSESDWDGWHLLTKKIGARVQLLGDDIFVTNDEVLRQGIASGAANAILIKVNQIGTLSETMRTIDTATRAGYGRMISHRSGETEDSFISHLAVATNAGQTKAGAPARGERTAKYNQLLRIEELLGSEARYAGWDAFRRYR